MQRHLFTASLVASSCFFSSPAFAQLIRTDPSEVLSKDEFKALEELKAAGGNRLSSVGATVDKEAGLVNLHFHRPLTADDTQRLRRITRLGTLFFTSDRNGAFSDQSLRCLDGVGTIGLVIWNQPVTDEGLKALKLLPKLIHLSLYGTPVTDAGLVFLKDTQLERLFVVKGDITDAGLETIGQLGSLKILGLSQCDKITDDGIAHLSSLANVENLFLHNNDLLSSAVLARIKPLKTLKRLGINAAKVNAEDLRHLQGFDRLEMFSTADTNLDDNGIKFFSALPSLREVNLQRTKITDTSLAVLGKMSQLSSLGLSKTEITDEGLARLGALKDLKSLNLSGTHVGDKGLSALKGLTKLERLSLGGTKVTDASVEVISGFKGLTYLNVEGCAISAEGKKRIAAQLPRCKVVQPARAVPPPMMRPRPPRGPAPLPPKRDKGPDIRDRLTGYRPSSGALVMRPLNDAIVERCAA